MNARAWWIGAAALGVVIVGSGRGNTANAADSARQAARSHFALTLGGLSVGLVGSVEGGAENTSAPVQQVGGHLSASKSMGRASYTPFAVKFGNTVGTPLFEWMKASMSSDQRKDGTIVALDYDFKERQTREFHQALITEVDLPKLSAGSKDAIDFTVKFIPETALTTAGSGVTMNSNSLQKAFAAANFQLHIAGLEDACSKIMSIEPITIKKKVVTQPSGDSKNVLVGSTSIEVSNLVVTLPEAAVKGFADWQKSIVQGEHATNLKAGTLDYLSPNRQQTLFEVAFTGLSLTKLTFDKVDAHADAIRKATVEMAVQKVSFAATP